MGIRRTGIFAIGLLLLASLQACSSDEEVGAGGGASSSGASGTDGTSGGASGGTSGGASGGTSGTGTSGGASGGTSGGTSGTTSGGPGGGGEDEALIPPNSIWRKTTEWYRPISDAPTAETSGEMIGALAQWGTSGIFQIDFSLVVQDAAKATTKIKVAQEDEADNDPVPLPPNGYLEGDYKYGTCPADDDCHLLVVDRTGGFLFEVWQAQGTGANWTGFEAFWNIGKSYPRTNRGLGCSSADAAGLPIVPGIIGYKETKKGAINHALRFIIRNDYIRGQAGNRNIGNNVYPASHGSTAGNAAKGVPYGGRLRLKKTIDENDPRIKTPGAKAVVRALHNYGMILADGGNIPLVAESVKLYKDANPAETWDGLLAPRDLGFIKPSDFEVVSIPKADPTGAPGWYTTRAEYEGQLKKPLGCAGIVQP